MNLLMRSALHALSRHRVAAIAFGAAASVLAACESAGTGSGTNPSSVGALSNGVPLTTSGLGYSFQSYIVGANTKITGINDDKNGLNPPIVGVDYGTGSNPKYTSFIAFLSSYSGTQYGPSAPYPSGTPPGSSVYISAINDIASGGNYGVAGFSPPFDLKNGCTSTSRYCGLIYDPKVSPKLYQVQDPSTGTTPCSATYLSGTSASTVQVGYYTDALCNAHAIEEYKYPGASPQFVKFQLSSLGCNGVQSWAYGINRLGDVVGACTTSSTSGLPPMIGWEYIDFQYLPIIFKDPTTHQLLWTQALGINPPDQVVGSYEDSTTNHVMHGFVGKDNGTVLYSVNYTAGGKTYPTVANSISILQTIVGWYYNTPNSLAGFIATCTTTTCPFGNSSGLSRRGGSTSARGIGSAIRQRP
jgi:hypothetical protein